MLEYVVNDVLREFLIFIGEIFLILRSLQLFSLSGRLCYMSGLKDAACVVNPINLATAIQLHLCEPRHYLSSVMNFFLLGP